MSKFLFYIYTDQLIYRLLYVLLIAPTTSESRMKLFYKLTDSFIYVVL